MKVKFLPINKEIEITPEKTLLQAALENHIDIKSICKGKLICAECRVKVVEGEANCLPPSKAELNLIGSAWQLDSRRYACQVRCFGDVTVDITEQVQRSESQRKNIRGFKSNRSPSESTAVIDTMILTEKIETPDGTPREERGERQERGGGRREGGQTREAREGGEGQQTTREKDRGGRRGGRGRRGGGGEKGERRDGKKGEGGGENRGEGRGETRNESRGENRNENRGGKNDRPGPKS